MEILLFWPKFENSKWAVEVWILWACNSDNDGLLLFKFFKRQKTREDSRYGSSNRKGEDFSLFPDSLAYLVSDWEKPPRGDGKSLDDSVDVLPL